jgi:hypothetical protein
MVPPRSRLPILASDVTLSGSPGPGQVPVRGTVSNFSAPRVAGRDALLRGPVGSPTRAVVADPCRAQETRTRIVPPAPHGGPETLTQLGQRPRGAASQVHRADDGRCVCPLSGHVTDTERALMADITRQAARLSTALCWFFALAALAGLVLLMRWSR